MGSFKTSMVGYGHVFLRLLLDGLCSRSMLPDVVDDFTVKNPECKDLEPMFFSCYAFCNKLGGGLSVGISTILLQ